MKIILFVIILISSFTAHSKVADYRPGFIVNQEQDTIKGFILYKTGSSRHDNCTFKTSENSEPIEYSPAQIVGYGIFQDAYYESKKIKVNEGMQNFFAEILVKGKASLLKVKEQFYLEYSDTTYILETKTSQVGKKVRIKELYKGILNWKLTGCDKVMSNKIQSVSLNEPALTKLFKSYNNCFVEKRPKNPSLENKKPWTEFRLGGAAGISFISMDKLPHGNMRVRDEFKKDKSLTTGLSLALTSPRASERFSLNLEILYQKATNEDQYVNGTVTQTLYLEYSTLQIPLSFAFNLNTKSKTKFFIESGFKTLFVINSSSYYLNDQDFGSIINTYTVDNFLEIDEGYFSIMAGAGLTRSINPKLQFFIKSRYEFGPAVINHGEQQTVSVLTGILMKIK